MVEDEYHIAFRPPADMLLVTDVEESELLIRGPTITVDEQNVSALDIGFTQPSAIGNFVWLDTNKDGLVDPDEQGVSEVIVRLLDADGAVLDVTTTDSDGRFEFLVTPGDYQLEVIATNGLEFTMQNQGDDSKDSDVDVESGRTAVISIEPGETDFSHFAGLIVSPTAIQLMSLTATETAVGVAVEWIIGSEIDTFGFQVLRSRSSSIENAVEVTENVILGGSDDGFYTFIDTTARVGQVYSYWLIEVQNDQASLQYGPTRVMVGELRSVNNGFTLFLPFIQK